MHNPEQDERPYRVRGGAGVKDQPKDREALGEQRCEERRDKKREQKGETDTSPVVDLHRVGRSKNRREDDAHDREHGDYGDRVDSICVQYVGEFHHRLIGGIPAGTIIDSQADVPRVCSRCAKGVESALFNATSNVGDALADLPGDELRNLVGVFLVWRGLDDRDELVGGVPNQQRERLDLDVVGI